MVQSEQHTQKMEGAMTRALIIRHHEAETMGANFRAILKATGSS